MAAAILFHIEQCRSSTRMYFRPIKALQTMTPLYDPDAPVKGVSSIQYDFRLGAAAGDGTGRIGADPAQVFAAVG
jgi:hypothetical protein